MSKDQDNQEGVNKSESEILKEKTELLEASQIYNSKEKVVTMSKLKATNISTVIRLFPPRPAGGQNEMKIQEQTSLAKEAFKKYRDENCDDKGKQKNINLTGRQVERNS